MISSTFTVIYRVWLVWVFLQCLSPREASGRELVKVLLLTVGLCCLLISTALINVCLYLTQRLPDGTVALIMVVCMCVFVLLSTVVNSLFCGYTSFSTTAWILHCMSGGHGVTVSSYWLQNLQMHLSNTIEAGCKSAMFVVHCCGSEHNGHCRPCIAYIISSKLHSLIKLMDSEAFSQ